MLPDYKPCNNSYLPQYSYNQSYCVSRFVTNILKGNTIERFSLTIKLSLMHWDGKDSSIVLLSASHADGPGLSPGVGLSLVTPFWDEEITNW